MNLPSVSTSSMQTAPVAEAAWEMDTELLASCSSTSTRFLFPWVVRTLRLLDEARVTVTREEGDGDSFNLDTEEPSHPRNHGERPPQEPRRAHRSSSPSRSLR